MIKMAWIDQLNKPHITSTLKKVWPYFIARGEASQTDIFLRSLILNGLRHRRN